MQQLLSLTAMEPPSSFNAKACATKRSRCSGHPPDPAARRCLGQYRGYRGEPNVAPESHTPTYVALRLFIDNWRWQGVPFYVRCGKALGGKTTEISLHFKQVPHLHFPRTRPAAEFHRPLHPAQRGIQLRFETKVPGAGMRADPWAWISATTSALASGAARCLRTAAARRHAGRRSALRPQRRDRTGLGARRSPDGPVPPYITSPGGRVLPRPTISWPVTARLDPHPAHQYVGIGQRIARPLHFDAPFTPGGVTFLTFRRAPHMMGAYDRFVAALGNHSRWAIVWLVGWAVARLLLATTWPAKHAASSESPLSGDLSCIVCRNRSASSPW
jgi:hypothetical protein